MCLMGAGILGCTLCSASLPVVPCACLLPLCTNKDLRKEVLYLSSLCLLSVALGQLALGHW